MRKKASRFTDSDQAAPVDEYKEVRVSAAEYHQDKLDEFRAKMKEKLRNQFRNSFVQKGALTFNRNQGYPVPDETAGQLNTEASNENKEIDVPVSIPSKPIDCLENIEDQFGMKDKYDADPIYDDEI